MGRLTPTEADQLATGIRHEMAVLSSLLTEAEEHAAWLAAGHDTLDAWLGQIPPMPGLTVPKGTVPRPAAVSRPGSRQEVTTNFKGRQR